MGAVKATPLYRQRYRCIFVPCWKVMCLGSENMVKRKLRNVLLRAHRVFLDSNGKRQARLDQP